MWKTDLTARNIIITYRVQARPSVDHLPKYLLDPRYSVTYTTTGFLEHDSVTLVSANTESETDSPIWVYDVVYVGAGERLIAFETGGEVESPMFAVANNETDPGGPGNPVHCSICGHTSPSQCTSACTLPARQAIHRTALFYCQPHKSNHTRLFIYPKRSFEVYQCHHLPVIRHIEPGYC